MVTLSAPPPPTPYDPKNWGERVDVDTIRRIPVPVQGPDSWRPLPHDTFITMVEQVFQNNGFEISEPVHYRAKTVKNAKIQDQGPWGRFISLYGIAHPGLPETSGMTWEAGFVNSYDMTKSASGGLGSRVSVCSNGKFMGAETQFRRKHTVGIDRDRDGSFPHVHSLVHRAIENLLPAAVTESVRIDRWKNIECSDEDARWSIMEAAKRKVIGAAATMRILEHWEEPEHPEFEDRNVWSLENAFTSNDRGQSLLTQSDRFSSLGTIFDERFGEAADEEPTLVAADF